MRLPKMGNRERSGRSRIGAFRGLDRTDGAGEGDIVRSENLSSRRFPYLAPRAGRVLQSSYVRPTALYAWGSLVVVDGTSLLYKGQVVGTVSEGAKQFAVVNTKLVIWPDKAILDLGTGRFYKLTSGAAIQGTVQFTADKLTISSIDPLEATAAENFTYSSDAPPKVMKYTDLSWEEGVWKKTGEAEADLRALKAGDLLIPTATETESLRMNTRQGEGQYEPEAGGTYLKVTKVSAAGTTECRWEKWSVSSVPYTYYTQGAETSSGSVAGYEFTGYSSYSFNSSTGIFTGIGLVTVKEGQRGTAYTTYNGGRGLTRAVSDGENVTFYDRKSAGPYVGYSSYKGSTSYGYVYAEKGTYPQNASSGGYWYVYGGETGFEGTVTVEYELRSQGNRRFTSIFTAGDRVDVSGCTVTPGNNVEKAKIVKVEDYALTFAAGTFTAAAAETGAVTITKPVPDLDYICASNNRLWGVSNGEGVKVWNSETQEYEAAQGRTIWASALGLPDRFYDYDGVSTDSYAVAVGTDGDFSGIIDYSGSILCFKEEVLHRVTGDYPANYSVYTDSITGLELGSWRSMVIINEVLYYKGRYGVYAYTGAQPVLISHKLGRERFTNGVAGEHAGKYYLGVRSGAGERRLFTYDTVEGVWYEEDGLAVEAFASLEGQLYALSGSGVYIMDAGGDEAVEWSATLAPFQEEGFSRRAYRWLRLDAEVPEGGVLRCTVAVNGRPDQAVYQTGEAGRRQISIPLGGARAEWMQLTLSGRGDVVIRGVEREFAVLSEEEEARG